MSSERIDHAAEAVRVLRDVSSDANGTYADAMAYAQAHATLALVEQQRVANVIELAKGAAGTDAQQAARSALVIKTADDFGSPKSVRPEIREALGL